MANNYDDADGVWRTVGGRRIFIRTGQSLSDAMKSSGKFKSQKKIKMSYEDKEKEMEKLAKKMDELSEQDKDDTEEFKKLEKQYDNLMEQNKDEDRKILNKDNSNESTYEDREAKMEKLAERMDKLSDEGKDDTPEFRKLEKQYDDLMENNKNEDRNFLNNVTLSEEEKQFQDEVRKKGGNPHNVEYIKQKYAEMQEKGKVNIDGFSYEKQDDYETKVYGSDVRKADEEMKKTFDKDFKYKEEKRIGEQYGKTLKENYSYHKEPEDKEQEESLYQEFKEKGKVGQSYSEYKAEKRTKDKIDKEAEEYSKLVQSNDARIASNLQIEKEFPHKLSEEVEHQAKMINSRGYDDIDDVVEDFAKEQGISTSEARYALLKDEFKTRQDNFIRAKQDGSYSEKQLEQLEGSAKDSYFKLQEAQEDYNNSKSINNNVDYDEIWSKMSRSDKAKINQLNDDWAHMQGSDEARKKVREEQEKIYNKYKNNNSMNDKIRNSAYKKYIKEHPGSKMTFDDFMKKNKK